MVKICVYEKGYKPVWDEFILKSKNGTFLFFRDYMEYHADRFTDHSLLFFEGDRLLAVLPASRPLAAPSMRHFHIQALRGSSSGLG